MIRSGSLLATVLTWLRIFALAAGAAAWAPPEACAVSAVPPADTKTLHGPGVSLAQALPESPGERPLDRSTDVPGLIPQPVPTASPAPLPPSPATRPGALEEETLLTEAERQRQKSLPITAIPVDELIPLDGGRLPPIRLEASYNQPIGLSEVLNLALEQNLPIKISQAGWDSQRYLYLSALGQFLPDYNLIYRVQQLYEDGRAPVDTRTFSSTVRLPVFQGGGVLFGAMSSYYRMRSARFQFSATVNDVLLDVYRRYNELLLNQVLLQIRLKAVEVSRAQLRLNQQLRDAGTGTNFAVMQSTTQLALDKQNLVRQQVAVRQAALQLAAVLNMNVAVNLLPKETHVTETRLVDENQNITQLSETALRNRPELYQFEAARLAQSRQIQVAAAPMFPALQFFISVNRAETLRRGAAAAATQQQVAAAQLGALVGTGAAGFGAGGGIVPGVGPLGIGGAASTVVIPAGGGAGGLAVGGTGRTSVTAGFDINWNLNGLGVPNAFNVQSQRSLARQALLQYNQQVVSVLTEVRQAYLNSLSAEEQVDVAGESVVAATEGLRLANLRLQHGAGTNLEVIQAQRDYITALINQAQAIINFNIAQAQLLRDVGLISVSTLTATPVNRPISSKPIKTRLF